MECLEKFRLFEDHAQYEVSDSLPIPIKKHTHELSDNKKISIKFPKSVVSPTNPSKSLPVYMAALPNGKRVPILKTLLTSACERNCYYCSCRSDRNFQRMTFQPEELANTYWSIWKSGLVQGIFLSSGIAGGSIKTQDRLIATAEILRNKYEYKDYLHLKIMPGADNDQIERAMQLADRVSINLEAPSTKHLACLAPQKTYLEELLRPLKIIEEIRKKQPSHLGWNHQWPSSTTQFVVGGSNESDFELLETTSYLYQALNLSRTYFAAFSPVPDTPLENQSPLDRWRQHRLYQASFLLKTYHFSLEDMPFNASGLLPIEIDPKMAWAQTYLTHNPIEINKAEYIDLLRIPGIGPKGAKKILQHRITKNLTSIENLKNLGINTQKLSPFILINGKRPSYQLSLW